MRIALSLEYDGSGFLGWQSQTGGGTVQDALETALSAIACEPVKSVCAGRTDRGVHACAQIVHFDTRADRPDTAWVRGVNALLPPAAAVLWAKPVADAFHARYSAITRTYRYVLLNRPVRPALALRYVGWTHAPLDVSTMHEAARFLTGEHDFSAFRSSECQARSPVRTVRRLDVLSRGGDRIDFVVSANAFLHHMVRNLVGTLLEVGKGRRSAGWVQDVLVSRDRSRAAPTASGSGLYLESVEYAPEWGIDAPTAATLPLGEAL